jgi:hypothetical protein
VSQVLILRVLLVSLQRALMQLMSVLLPNLILIRLRLT